LHRYRRIPVPDGVGSAGNAIPARPRHRAGAEV